MLQKSVIDVINRCAFGKKLVGLVVFILVVGIVLIPCATSGLRVSGAKFMENATPGATLIHTMTISIPNDSSAVNISVNVMGLGQSEDFTYIAIEPSKDTSPYSAQPFITLDKQSIHLDPGSSQEVNATIRIPPNIKQGGYYAIISIRTSAQGTQATGFATGVDVPILITIPGSGIVETGKVLYVNVSEAVAGGPITVNTAFTNTGNHHYYQTVDEILVTDSNGTPIFNFSTSPSFFAIFPGQTVVFEAPIQKPLGIGVYSVSSKILDANGKVFDKGNTTFTVNKGYIPPFVETSAMVTPQSATTIASSDGIISINFPQGAVLDNTLVTVKPVSSKDLPASPAGVRSVIMGFSIDGISGLLSKPASITLKYNPDDLDAANGDASKLFLARWDKSENKWSLIPTKVDKSAMTLTATTDRLSTWAVMVSEGAVPTETAGAEGTKTPGFTFGIACGALALLFVVNRFRRR